MAEKEPLIVIKKITIEEGGAHGGAWKVAFADFMTSMMTFFLVMWLIAAASPQAKKNVANYFSTPSVIEYNFSNYGVELSLEKLFLDLIHEPLRFFQEFITPTNESPNIMRMGMRQVAIAHLALELGSVAKNVKVSTNKVEFDIPDYYLFRPGTAYPTGRFLNIMTKVEGITAGLDHANVRVDSYLYDQSVKDGNRVTAENVAMERTDMILEKIQASFSTSTVDASGRAIVSHKAGVFPGEHPAGRIHITISNKSTVANSPNRHLSDGIFKPARSDDAVYESFVKKLVNKRE